MLPFPTEITLCACCSVPYAMVTFVFSGFCEWHLTCSIPRSQGGQKHIFKERDEDFQMRKQKGFSLIELLIVVAIILIIAAIAIPNLLRARIAANESSAVSSVRTINTAEVTYQSAYPTWGYADTLAKLGPGGAGSVCGVPSQANSCMLDSALSNAIPGGAAKSGYFFDVKAQQNGGTLYLNYQVGASAAVFNQTGVRDFCSIEDGVLHFDVPNAQTNPTAFTGAAGNCTPLSILQ